MLHIYLSKPVLFAYQSLRDGIDAGDAERFGFSAIDLGLKQATLQISDESIDEVRQALGSLASACMKEAGKNHHPTAIRAAYLDAFKEVTMLDQTILSYASKFGHQAALH